MNIESTFVDVITDCRKSETKPRLSSKIKQWLGIDIPQSLCIRIGNYIEKFLYRVTDTYQDLIQLDYNEGCYGVWYENEFHQIDFIKITPDCIYHREVKTNTDLDRGKKRDTLSREIAIVKALAAKFNRSVDSAIFCPFFVNSQIISGLGTVEGMTEFINTFSAQFTVDDFIRLGKSKQVHNALLQ